MTCPNPPCCNQPEPCPEWTAVFGEDYCSPRYVKVAATYEYPCVTIPDPPQSPCGLQTTEGHQTYAFALPKYFILEARGCGSWGDVAIGSTCEGVFVGDTKAACGDGKKYYLCDSQRCEWLSGYEIYQKDGHWWLDYYVGYGCTNCSHGNYGKWTADLGTETPNLSSITATGFVWGWDADPGYVSDLATPTQVVITEWTETPPPTIDCKTCGADLMPLFDYDPFVDEAPFTCCLDAEWTWEQRDNEGNITHSGSGAGVLGYTKDQLSPNGQFGSGVSISDFAITVQFYRVCGDVIAHVTWSTCGSDLGGTIDSTRSGFQICFDMFSDINLGTLPIGSISFPLTIDKTKTFNDGSSCTVHIDLTGWGTDEECSTGIIDHTYLCECGARVSRCLSLTVTGLCQGFAGFPRKIWLTRTPNSCEWTTGVVTVGELTFEVTATVDESCVITFHSTNFFGEHYSFSETLHRASEGLYLDIIETIDNATPMQSGDTRYVGKIQLDWLDFIGCNRLNDPEYSDPLDCPLCDGDTQDIKCLHGYPELTNPTSSYDFKRLQFYFQRSESEPCKWLCTLGNCADPSKPYYATLTGSIDGCVVTWTLRIEEGSLFPDWIVYKQSYNVNNVDHPCDQPYLFLEDSRGDRYGLNSAVFPLFADKFHILSGYPGDCSETEPPLLSYTPPTILTAEYEHNGTVLVIPRFYTSGDVVVPYSYNGTAYEMNFTASDHLLIYGPIEFYYGACAYGLTYTIVIEAINPACVLVKLFIKREDDTCPDCSVDVEHLCNTGVVIDDLSFLRSDGAGVTIGPWEILDGD